MKFDVACLFSTSTAILLVRSQGNSKSFRVFNRRKSTRERALETKGSGKGKHTKGDDVETDDRIRRTDDVLFDDKCSDGNDADISNDDSELEAICETFNEYRNMTDSDGVDDGTIDPCDPFDSQSYLLCPGRYERGKICDGTSNETSIMNAIKEKYCVPLFDELYNQLLTGIVNSCVDSCVHYVSLDHGDCCDFVCPN